MKLIEKQAERVRDGFLAELTDAALAATARHGVQVTSVDQELDLWHALGEALGRPAAGRCEEVLADLTDAAYQETLRHGFRDSFLDVRLDLWHSLRKVFGEGRFTRRFFHASCA